MYDMINEFDTLFNTWTLNHVVPSSTKHTQFKTRVQKPYPSWDQNGQNRYPDQNI